MREQFRNFGAALAAFEAGGGLGANVTLPLKAEAPRHCKSLSERAQRAGASNIRAELRDFVELGSGVTDGSQGHAMVFNLLHIENPLALLRKAFRSLQPGGILSVIHWRSDIETPRGPPLAIRPKPEQCATWLSGAGFESVRHVELGKAAPYHFGILAQKPMQ